MTAEPRTTTEQPTVAVLGTGIMGGPMARRIAAAGMPVRAWNRTRAKAAPLEQYGVHVADSPADAAAGADLVVTMLLDADAVESAMQVALPAMRDDAVWIQASTVGVEGAERLARLAAERGIGYVDAPVLGTKEPAEQGTLTVLASGPDELRERCRPVFNAIGQATTWVGPAGNGSRLKLVANSWVLAVTEATAEAVALARGLGLDPGLFLDAISGGPLDAPYVHLKAGMMINGAYQPSFPLRGAAKDAGLILAAGQANGVDMAVIAAARRHFERAIELGHGDEDMAATYVAATDAAVPSPS